MGEKTGEVLGDTLLGSEGETWGRQCQRRYFSHEAGATRRQPEFEPDDDYNLEEGKGQSDVGTRTWTSSQQHHDDVEDQQEGDTLTLIPERLADDLVTGSLLLVHVLGGTVLLDLRIVVLGIAPVLVKSSHLDFLFNGRDIDVGHGMGMCQASTERTRECQHCYTCGGGAGSTDDDGVDERGVWISELEVL